MDRREANPANERRYLQKKRKTQWLVASTWITTVAAFFGFFTIWNHLGNSATAATGSSQTAVYSDGHHRRDGFDSGSSGSVGGGGSFASGSGSGFGSSGSAQVNPGQSSGQFVTRAS